jgi:L,D-transpeptidase catalytic domain/Putative peptidoglycan binding domain
MFACAWLALADGRTICRVKRAVLFIGILLAAAATLGVAAPDASPPPVVIAAGVAVGGVDVGGLTSEPARARIRAASARPLVFSFGERTWKATPAQLQARFDVDDAVADALVTETDGSVGLRARVPRTAVRRYVAYLARTFRRAPRNARLVGLVDGRPFVTRASPGHRVRKQAIERAIMRALEQNSREPIELQVRPLRPWITRANFGPVIVIDRGANALRLYRGMRPWRAFRVATGTARYPTPSGSFTIVDMQRYPWWYPPASDWAAGLKPIPPGPGNPLGTRWMGLSAGSVGIHGTPDAASVGYSASHGCIRMYLDEASWLFDHVRVGTPVFIV